MQFIFDNPPLNNDGTNSLLTSKFSEYNFNASIGCIVYAHILPKTANIAILPCFSSDSFKENL